MPSLLPRNLAKSLPRNTTEEKIDLLRAFSQTNGIWVVLVVQSCFDERFGSEEGGWIEWFDKVKEICADLSVEV